MSRKTKIQSGIYSYLEGLGLLANGTDAELKAAKAVYWKMKRKEHKRQLRNKNKVYEVILSAQENQVVIKLAREAGFSKVAWVKYAALAYANKRYLVPRLEIQYELRALLNLTYCSLQTLIDDNRINVHLEDILLGKVSELETKVLTLLFNPTAVDCENT